MYRAVYTRFFKYKQKKLARLSSSYNYEMPECYQKSFYMANASFHDNINWFYFRGIEVAFDRFVEKTKSHSPSRREEDVVRNVLNKVNMMDYCSHVMEVNFPLMRDSGRIEIVKGYCANHGTHYPTHLGGLRISQNVDKSQLRALATLASYKHICADVPFAGSHTGIKINPKEYSSDEMKRLISSFTKLIEDKRFIGPQVNIFSPDLNCSENIIGSMVQEFTEMKGNNSSEKDLACITGKSTSNGGLYNYNESVADGIFYGMDIIIKNELLMYKVNFYTGWEDKTYIIKNLDKIGLHLVKRLKKEGATCVGVSDFDASFYDENGIDIEVINSKIQKPLIKAGYGAIAFKERTGGLGNYFPEYNAKKILKEKCDILIITDASKKLDCYVAPLVEAKIIVEATSGAITPTAHRILVGKEKLVIPDLYINAGSSVASYIEYIKNMDSAVNTTQRESTRNLLFMNNRPYVTQNSPMVQYSPEVLDEENNQEREFLEPAIKLRMSASLKNILKMLREFNLDLDIRTAAYIMASERIFDLLQNERNI